jgi:hypothetical protein
MRPGELDLDPAQAANQLRGMLSHLAPGTSLAEELITDRRAEVRASGNVQGVTARRSTLGICPRIATT